MDGAVKEQNISGYCAKDGLNVTIPIEYISIPKVNRNDKKQDYYKSRNVCDYACDYNNKNECQIFKDAQSYINI